MTLHEHQCQVARARGISEEVMGEKLESSWDGGPHSQAVVGTMVRGGSLFLGSLVFLHGCLFLLRL